MIHLLQRTPLLCLFCLVVACGGSSGATKKEASTKQHKTVAKQGKRGEIAAPLGKISRERCDSGAPGRDAREFDTSGDNRPDVRKVFKIFGEGTQMHMVLVCRQADLNDDQIYDAVRYYNDEGRPLREEADRNFDGKMDVEIVYDLGQIGREESDTDYDGIVDMKVFYEKGQVIRTERDLAKKSSADAWKPNQWEYFESGHLVRMGIDEDGDGNVDRWDRDSIRKPYTEDKADEGASAAAANSTGPDNAKPADNNAEGEKKDGETKDGEAKDAKDTKAEDKKGKGKKKGAKDSEAATSADDAAKDAEGSDAAQTSKQKKKAKK